MTGSDQTLPIHVWTLSVVDYLVVWTKNKIVRISLSGKNEIIDGLSQIIYLEDSYKLYNEIDTAYNTPWSLFYDLTARV